MNTTSITNGTKGLTELTLENERLKLSVSKPLWKEDGSFLDVSRALNLELSAYLLCSDGRHKQIHMKIPFHDENTARPFFEKKNYTFIVPPCSSQKCAMNFANPIKVIDIDRDEENAEMIFFADHLSILVSSQPEHLPYLPWLGHQTENYIEGQNVQSQGYYTRVHLYLQGSEQYRHGSSLTFVLQARNVKLAPNDVELMDACKITLKFETMDDPVFGIPAPVFSHSFYHVTIDLKDFIANIGRELKDIQPQKVEAFSQQRETETTPGVPQLYHVRYWMDSQLFHVHWDGRIVIQEDAKSLGMYLSVLPHVEVFEIHALGIDFSRWPPDAKVSTASLLAFFHDSTTPEQDECLPEFPGTIAHSINYENTTITNETIICKLLSFTILISFWSMAFYSLIVFSPTQYLVI